jgi:hypothetical protein
MRPALLLLCLLLFAGPVLVAAPAAADHGGCHFENCQMDPVQYIYYCVKFEKVVGCLG